MKRFILIIFQILLCVMAIPVVLINMAVYYLFFLIVHVDDKLSDNDPYFVAR